MKKIYESPESVSILIGLHGQLLDNMSEGEPGGTPGWAPEHNSSIWDNGDDKGGKKIFDEEW